jgi:signal transduction histidine kinase
MSRLTGVAVVAKESEEVSVDDPEVSMHLYRIAQEAVANAVRHSGAHEITINLKKTGTELELCVEDDGTGIAKEAQAQGTTGMGLRTMRYRAQTLGASLEIASKHGGGTIVRCRMRLKPNRLNTDHDQN